MQPYSAVENTAFKCHTGLLQCILKNAYYPDPLPITLTTSQQGGIILAMECWSENQIIRKEILLFFLFDRKNFNL